MGLTSAGGFLNLNDTSGNNRVNINIDSNGGACILKNSSSKDTAGMITNSAGGYLYINTATEKNAVKLNINAKGGEALYYNSSRLCAYMGAGSTSGDGVFFLMNSSGTDKIYGQGQTGQLTCVSLVQTSSRKVKENIKPLTDEEAKKILELEAVSFDYKNKDEGTDKRGFIAEDVAEVLPNLVTPEQEGRPATLDYIEMIPYLQAIIKQQELRIKALEEMIQSIKGE